MFGHFIQMVFRYIQSISKYTTNSIMMLYLSMGSGCRYATNILVYWCHFTCSLEPKGVYEIDPWMNFVLVYEWTNLNFGLQNKNPNTRQTRYTEARWHIGMPSASYWDPLRLPGSNQGRVFIFEFEWELTPRSDIWITYPLMMKVIMSAILCV